MNHYIVFDWDGTLHNTKKLYAESVRKAYAFLVDKQCANLREFTDDELSKYLGMTAKEMWDDFMPELNPDIQSQAEHTKSIIKKLINHEHFDDLLYFE